jgi:uncharacterized protein (TIGR03437 family)
VAPSQINGIMASNAPLGVGQLTVTYNGVTSAPVSVKVVRHAFGAFTMGAGSMAGIIQNMVPGGSEAPLNSGSTCARPGVHWAVLWGTGLGANMAADRVTLLPDNMPPPGGYDLPATVEVIVGGKVAEKRYSGRAPGFAGVDNIYYVVPSDAPTGCAVPVQVKVGDSVSNTVTMAIDPQGNQCSDPGNPFTQLLQAGNSKVGLAGFFHATATIDFLGRAMTMTMDMGIAGFVQVPQGAPLSPIASLPALGSCTTLSLADPTGGDTDNPAAAAQGLAGLLVGASGARYLDAGQSLTLYQGRKPDGADNRPKVNLNRDPEKPEDKTYSAVGGFGQPVGSFLGATTYELTNGTGTGEVGPFSVTFDTGTLLMFQPNIRSLAQIDRSAPLVITWTGGDPDKQAVLISGGNTDPVTKQMSGFVCMAPLRPGRFEVPTSALAMVPPSPASPPDAQDGVLIVNTQPFGTYPTFTAQGIEKAIITFGTMEIKTLRVK